MPILTSRDLQNRLTLVGQTFIQRVVMCHMHVFFAHLGTCCSCQYLRHSGPPLFFVRFGVKYSLCAKLNGTAWHHNHARRIGALALLIPSGYRVAVRFDCCGTKRLVTHSMKNGANRSAVVPRNVGKASKKTDSPVLLA